MIDVDLKVNFVITNDGGKCRIRDMTIVSVKDPSCDGSCCGVEYLIQEAAKNAVRCSPGEEYPIIEMEYDKFVKWCKHNAVEIRSADMQHSDINWDLIPVSLTPYGFLSNCHGNKKSESELKASGYIGDPINAGVVKQILHAQWFIQKHCIKTNGITRKYHSYGLKHIAEAMPPRHYITNGAFIAAAILEGYRYKQIKYSPNCEFNIKLDKASDKFNPYIY